MLIDVVGEPEVIARRQAPAALIHSHAVGICAGRCARLAGVVDDEVGLREALLACRLTGDPRPRVGFVHAAEANQPIDGDVDRRVDDDHSGDRIAAVLDQQRHVEHDDAVGAEVLAHAFANRPTDRRVRDRVELLQQLGVRKHDARRGAARSSCAVVADDALAESLDDRVEHRRAGLLQLAGRRHRRR